MAKIKTIYPPIVPNLLPAFDGVNDDLKFYFKPSIANSMDQVESLQVSIARLDTNRTVLNSNDYPYDLIFIIKENILYDEVKKYYYFIIPKNIFQQLDTAYKVQVRIASTEASARPTDLKGPAMNQWLKDNLDFFSEWSIVTTVMPITVPDFGIQGLSEADINGLNSSGYEFVGYYEPKDPNKSETLSFYRLNLYSYRDYNDTSTWTLYSTSGDKRIGAYDKININYVFDKDLLQAANYVVGLSIRTKNLYAKTKYYKVIGEYPMIEMFNTINTIVDKDEGKIDITINAKQILMKPSFDGSVSYIADDPDLIYNPYLDYSHAVIKGDIYSGKNFFMSSLEDKWVAQAKVKIDEVHDTLKKAYSNPFITIKYNTSNYGDVEYSSQIKICAFKIDLNGGYDLMDDSGNIIEQVSDWEYRIIARKEIVSRTGNVETVLLSQNRTYKTKEAIVPQQEYYIFLRELQGLMDFEVMKTYKS